jgi:hypothetical protein
MFLPPVDPKNFVESSAARLTVVILLWEHTSDVLLWKHTSHNTKEDCLSSLFHCCIPNGLTVLTIVLHQSIGVDTVEMKETIPRVWGSRHL